MLRIFIFVLSVFFPLEASAFAGIEIDANGRQYGSLEAYLASEKTTSVVTVSSTSETSRDRLFSLSVEDGMHEALQDFKADPKGPDGRMILNISPDQLQEAIEHAVSRFKGPILLISEPGKVRIMSLASSEQTK